MTKDEALAVFQKTLPEYVLRWTDSRGDFSGRENTIDVFGVAVREQRNTLRRLEEAREDIKKSLKINFIFVFRDRKWLTA